MTQPTGGLSRKAQLARGALTAYLKPKLAADQQLPDLRRVLLGATESNWAQAVPVIERRLNDAMRGRLAKDQGLDDVNELLDRLQEQHEKKKEPDDKEDNGGGGDPNVEEDRAVVRFRGAVRGRDQTAPDDNPEFGEVDPLDDNKGQKTLGAADDEDEKDMEPIMSFLSSKLAPEDLHEMRGMADAAMDRRVARDRQRAADQEARDKAGPQAIVGGTARDWNRAKVGKVAKDRRRVETSRGATDDNKEDLPEEFKEQMKTDDASADRRFGKQAMDSAIRDAVKAATETAVRRQSETREAERVCRQYVGEMLAQDSAEDTYRTALEMLGVKTDGLHRDALRPILEAQPKPGRRSGEAARSKSIAQDAARPDLATRFPGFDRLKRVAI